MGCIIRRSGLAVTFNIGQVKLVNPVVLAPMAGVTDAPFRRIVSNFNPGLLCGEMVNAVGLVHGNNKTRQMISRSSSIIPYSQQIFGNEPSTMARAAQLIERMNVVDIIDINMGCPAPKITRNNEGAALLSTPDLAVKIVSSVKEATRLPVTVKMRLGMDSTSINVIEIAKKFEYEGIDGVILHGRTCEEGYSGVANWNYIRELKNRLTIPVIGNGDINTSEQAVNMLHQTGCDGVMIGRAVMGDPWLLGNIVERVTKGENIYHPSVSELIELALRHVDLAVSIKGEATAIREMRKHLSWYIKGLVNARELRDELMNVDTKDEIEELLLRYLNKNKHSS